VTKDQEIEVYRTALELRKNAAERIIMMFNRAIAERGVCFAALSGGETPRPVYRLLGTAPMKDRIDWSCVHLFLTDERCVPPADPQSNFGMVNRELISHIAIPSENVHRIQGEILPELAAADYNLQLKEYLRDGIVRFDVVLLGLGGDGHTASIFPGTAAVEEEKAFALAVFVPRLNHWRVTLTFRCINNTREVIFLVSGKQKASIVQRVLFSSKPQNDIPAAIVQPEDGKLLWMIDKDAAGGV